MVADMSDEDIWHLNRGGHDPHKVYAAYHAAVKHKGQPTVILAKTVKGYGMGEAGEGQNITHQQKKIDDDALKQFRDRFDIPVPDDRSREARRSTSRPKTAPEMKYLHDAARDARRLPAGSAARASSRSQIPRARLLRAAARRHAATARSRPRWRSCRCSTTLLRDKSIGKRIVPIVPDEARTFGMEGMFRQLGIYSSLGQLYKPQDADQLMFYREDKNGQILEEGINEAGAMCSWIARGTSYATHGVPMIPFYIYYSMFGFQRVGDLAWAGGRHARARLPARRHRGPHDARTAKACSTRTATATCSRRRSRTASRTTRRFAYEVAVIIQDGMRRMYRGAGGRLLLHHA